MIYPVHNTQVKLIQDLVCVGGKGWREHECSRETSISDLFQYRLDRGVERNGIHLSCN